MIEGDSNKRNQLSDRDNNVLADFCRQIRETDSSIMSLTIADAHGDIISQSHGTEYEREFLGRAAGVRTKAGAWAALMLGMEYEVDEVFGETECIVRVHKNGKLMIVPFPSKKMILVLLTKKQVDSNNVLPKIRPILDSFDRVV